MNTNFAHSSAITAEREFLLWTTITHSEFALPMKTKNKTSQHEPSQAEIQHTAYLLWVEAGQPEGLDQQHWFAAREMLRGKSRGAKPHRRTAALAASAAR